MDRQGLPAISHRKRRAKQAQAVGEQNGSSTLENEAGRPDPRHSLKDNAFFEEISCEK
jgi:hypothetical protein